MSEPTVTCPACSHVIKLTESLAAPLMAATKAGFERQLAQKDQDILAREAALSARASDLEKAEGAVAARVAAQVNAAKEKLSADVAKREVALQEQLKSLDQTRAELSDQVDARVKAERGRIAAEEAKKAKALVSSDLEQRTKDLADLKEVLDERTAKLSEAQKAQADLLKKQRELDDAKRELDVTVEKKVQESLGAVRERAKTDLEDAFKLRLGEKDETIASMQRKIEDLARKADQGSQQLQGEVLELELESTLRSRFPRDIIEPVPKGEHGGDILHRVIGTSGQLCGTILWESKRAKNWSDGWLTKLRDDQRSAKADIALIVTTSLPKGVKTFDLVDGVWITEAHCLAPVASSTPPDASRTGCDAPLAGGPTDEDGAGLPIPHRASLQASHRSHR